MSISRQNLESSLKNANYEAQARNGASRTNGTVNEYRRRLGCALASHKAARTCNKVGGAISASSGFSTMELMISMVIFVMTITGIILVVFGNQTVALDNQVNAEALLKANILLEEANAQSRVDFYSLESASSSVDIYEQELLISEINPCKTNGTASISWSTEAGRPLNVTLKSTYINTAEAIALAGDCGSDELPVTEWWYPDTFTDVDLKTDGFGANNSGVGATSVDILEKENILYAILSTKHSSEKDIWVTNVEDSSNPLPVSALETTTEGVNNLDAVGDKIFAVTSGTTANPSILQIINIASTSNPTLLATRSLDISGDCTGSPNYCPDSPAIYYYDGLVYIGTHRTNGDEFQIFQAVSPYSRVGSLMLNHNVFKIIVRGDFAYLTTSDDGGEMMIIDINPLSPDYLVHPDTTGRRFNAAGDYNGRAMYIVGNKLYIGRIDGDDSPYEPNLIVLDINDPDNILTLGSKLVVKNPPNPSAQAIGVLEMVVAGPFAFLGTDQSSGEFQVYRIENPTNIYNCNELGPPYPPLCGVYDFPAKITDFEYHNNLIYATVESNITFRIIHDDISLY